MDYTYSVMQQLEKFLREATRRRVLHISALYIIGAWVLLQASDLMFPGFDVDESAIIYVWIGVVLGYPIALVFGWRFDISDGRIAHTPDNEGDTDTELRQSDYIVLSTLTLAAVAITAVLGYQISQTRTIVSGEFTGVAGPAENVAVLPLVNLSDDGSNQYFTDGLTEELINTLSRLDGLQIASRTSTNAFRGSDLDVRIIARRLGVGSLLEGSVRRDGRRIRVAAQLINGTNGFEIWSDTFDRELDDIFAIQEEIARAVAKGLKVALVNEVIRTQPTDSLDAYDYYLQGLSYLRRPPTEGDLNIAIGLFKHATALDDGYAAAYAGICQAHLAEYRLLGAPRLVDEAGQQCTKALELDEQLLEVHLALGDLYRLLGQFGPAEEHFNDVLTVDANSIAGLIGLARTYESDGRLAEAESKFKDTIQVNPGDWTSHMAYAEFLYWQGRFEEAQPVFENAIESNPRNAHAYSFLAGIHRYAGRNDEALYAVQTSIRLAPRRAAYRDLGLHYYYEHHFDLAVAAFEKALEYGRDDHWTWGSLGQSTKYLNDQDEASRRAFEKAADMAASVLKINDKDWRALGKLAMYRAYLGEYDEAETIVERVMQNGAHLSEVSYFAAHTYLMLGRANDALAALAQAIDLGYPVLLISKDPELDALHEYERFRLLTASTQ